MKKALIMLLFLNIATAYGNIKSKTIIVKKQKKGTAILVYNITHSPQYFAQSMPRLTIYNDGTVFAGDPKGLKRTHTLKENHITHVKGKISKKRLNALMRFVVEKQDIYNISGKEISEHEKHFPQIMDADTTTFKVNTTKGIHRIRVYHLYGKRSSKFQPYRKLNKIAAKLENLRKEVIQQIK